MADTTIKHIYITITGKVQGVSFRASTKAVADQLGVKGIITNQKDGSVYIEAEADRLALESFLEWCEEGPEESRVEKITTQESEVKGYRNFEVIKKLNLDK